MKKKSGIEIRRKTGVLLAACVVMGSLAACGAKTDAELSASEEPASVVENLQTETNTEEDGEVSGGIENFDVDAAQAKEYAQKVQKTVADKDIEALADLMTFPNYVSIYEEKEGMVNTREEFLAIGKDRIFTKELIDSVANADLDNFTASMAGFQIVSKDDTRAPGISFGINDGELRINGINY